MLRSLLTRQRRPRRQNSILLPLSIVAHQQQQQQSRRSIIISSSSTRNNNDITTASSSNANLDHQHHHHHRNDRCQQQQQQQQQQQSTTLNNNNNNTSGISSRQQHQHQNADNMIISAVDNNNNNIKLLATQEGSHSDTRLEYYSPDKNEHECIMTFERTIPHHEEQEEDHEAYNTNDNSNSNSNTLLHLLRRRFQRYLHLHFFPKGYPHSVTPNYASYCKWQAMAHIVGAMNGVLSTQSLLYAVGLGSGSIPMAAALNWVLKDGLGQLGGVLFASKVNVSFDSEPKKWRFRGALALDLATLLEIITPLMPSYFLLMASIANIGKNVSCLAGSASRAAIHKSFTRRENLADITGKAGSQSIATSLIGTGLGVAVSPLVGSAFHAVLPAFLALSALHLYGQYRSLSVVCLNTFNVIRAEEVIYRYLASGCQEVLSPEQVSKKLEPVLLPHKSPFHHRRHYSRSSSSSSSSATTTTTTATNSATRSALLNKTTTTMIVHTRINPRLDTCIRSPHQLRHLRDVFAGERYMIQLQQQQQGEPSATAAATTATTNINLWYLHDASPEDVIKGFFHAKKIHYDLLTSSSSSAPDVTPASTMPDSSLSFVNAHIGDFLHRIEQQGWTTKNNFLEEEKGSSHNKRITLHMF